MKLVIPFFQSEFDALQLLVNRFGEIPPSGDWGFGPKGLGPGLDNY